MPRYFKVTNLRQESICTSRTREASGLGGLYDFVVCYEPGHWVGPNHDNSKLFVFDNLIDAERFGARIMANSDGYQIWECEVDNPADCYPFFLKSVFNKSFPVWLLRLLRGTESSQDDDADLARRVAKSEKAWPRGTVFVDAVKLTRLVAVRYLDCRTLLILLVRHPLVLLRRPRVALQILARSFCGAIGRDANSSQERVNAKRTDARLARSQEDTDETRS